MYVASLIFIVPGVLAALIAGPLARVFVDLGAERAERSSLRSKEGIDQLNQMLRSPDTYTMLVWGLRTGGVCLTIVGVIAAFAHH